MGRWQTQRRAAAAAELVATALPLVWRYARGMSGRDDTAREVVHEVVRLVGGDSFDDLPTETQLLARARLACRGGVVEGPAPVPDGESTAVDDTDGQRPPGASGNAGTGRLRSELTEELLELETDDREALLLLDVLGLDVDRVAEICDVAPAALYERRHRAHVRLVARVVGEEL